MAKCEAPWCKRSHRWHSRKHPKRVDAPAVLVGGPLPYIAVADPETDRHVGVIAGNANLRALAVAILKELDKSKRKDESRG